MTNQFDRDLDKNAANYTPLTPLSFLPKAAAIYPERTAVIHGDYRVTWKEFYARSRRLASALARHGVGRGTTVSAMLSNTPEMLEMHYGPAMVGAVLNSLNTRLDAKAIAHMLQHGGARVLFTDREFSSTIAAALRMCASPPLVIDVLDPVYTGPGERLGMTDYEQFLAEGDPEFEWRLPDDDWDAIALSYTSGTTGNPKGVVTHHRGTHQNAISNILEWSMPKFAVYLWTLPMFHCNGWCFPWTMPALGGTHVCLRRVETATIFDLIRKHRVNYYCCAPIVNLMLINAPAHQRQGISHKVHVMVAGASPSSAMIDGLAKLGFELFHTYGLTEVYGPAAGCTKQEEWDALPLHKQAMHNARQGVAYLLQQDMKVIDPKTMKPVPYDGKTIGEIMFRGNITMKGYLKNRPATDEAFAGGWFRTGDLGVTHEDGYIQILDRAKDIIISGGENVSSQEVEDVLSKHPAVLLAAVVAQPDEKWGEVCCAFVELKDGHRVDEKELIAFCRERIAHYKAPKRILFATLPKTSTGKIQKFKLRMWARDGMPQVGVSKL